MLETPTALLEQGYVAPAEGNLIVHLHCYPPTNHERDDDNMMARCKAYLDGIAWALHVKDSRFRTRINWCDKVKGGKVVAVIETPGAGEAEGAVAGGHAGPGEEVPGDRQPDPAGQADRSQGVARPRRRSKGGPR